MSIGRVVCARCASAKPTPERRAWPAPRIHPPRGTAPASLASRHAHRGPRTAGGPGRDAAPVDVPGAQERLLLGVLARRPRARRRRAPADRVALIGDPRPWTSTAAGRRSGACAASLEPGSPGGRAGSTSSAAVRATPWPWRAATSTRCGSPTSPPADTPASPRGMPTRRRGCSPPPLGLWRGEPYCDWPDAAFAEAERRRLAEIHAGAEADLAQARELAGAPARSRRRPRRRSGRGAR